MRILCEPAAMAAVSQDGRRTADLVQNDLIRLPRARSAPRTWIGYVPRPEESFHLLLPMEATQSALFGSRGVPEVVTIRFLGWFGWSSTGVRPAGCGVSPSSGG